MSSGADGVHVRVTFGARALVAANDGLDRAASAREYARLLAAALAAEWPGATIEVEPTDDAAPTRAAAPSPAMERMALDLAWTVRQCAPWAVR